MRLLFFRQTAILIAVLFSLLPPSLGELRAGDSDWPQFRGPGGTGSGDAAGALPAAIGPDKYVSWKVAIPSGHSSPAISGDRIYLTGEEGGRLFTFALERTSGTTLWRREAPHHGLESIHPVGSRAQASPATDGARVVSFFGSCGLFCYDRDGQELWRVPMGPFKNHYGAASSPLLVDDRVILNQDHDVESFLIALDKETGERIWTVDRSEFPRGFSTPAVWEVDGKKQIVVVGTLRAVGYDFASGEEVWTVRGLARIANPTPVVGGDGRLYLAAWSPGADPGARIQAAPYDEQLKLHDKNTNGWLESSEIPDGPLKRRFLQIDRDKSGAITRAEYDYMAEIFHSAKNGALAIRPGGRGDITETHVVWVQRRMIPYVASPLYHEGFLYLVKDGGIASSLDCRTGTAVRQARLPSRSNYYSSPVYGDGKIFWLSQRGELTVTTAQPEWEVLATAEFGEDAYATPAITDGHIYLRTHGHLYSFARAADARLVDARKIWDAAPHNAFTDLVHFRGEWFCVFREGSGHVSPDGALRVIVSDDGENWSSAARIESGHEDLRDAKMSITPDGRLMLLGAGALHNPDPVRHQSYVWLSRDGRNWDDAKPVGDPDFWLWRATWRDDRVYGVAYATAGPKTIRLYRGEEPGAFASHVADLGRPDYPNETSIVFLEDGTALCLLRHDPGHGELGEAKPPYTDWAWQDTGVRLGGPHLVELPDGRLVAAVRLYDDRQRTSLCWVDRDSGAVEEFLELPSGGDTSYAGLVWHDDLLWVSYYSSHEEKTSIYLARVTFGGQ
jgi:outer membrane protein assembly factor BamB